MSNMVLRDASASKNSHLLRHMSRSKEVAIFVSDVTSMEDQVVATAERVEEL